MDYPRGSSYVLTQTSQDFLCLHPNGKMFFYKVESPGTCHGVLGGYKYLLVDHDFAEWCTNHDIALKIIRKGMYRVEPNDENAAFEFKMRWL